MKIYTVGQIAKSMGVSTQTLRHYESLGLITSLRNDENQYRTYSLDDTRILFMISLYRSMGFSLPKIKKMLKEMTASEVRQSFAERITDIDAEIRALTLIKKELEHYHHGIQKAEEKLNQFWIEESSHTLFSIMKSGSGFSLENEKDNQLVEYQKMAPHVRQGFIISKEIWDQNLNFDFQYGVFMKQDHVEKELAQEEISKYMVTIQGPVAKTVIRTNGEPFSKEMFEPFFDWIKQQGLKINSDLYGVVRYHAYYEREVTIFEFQVSVI